MNMGMNMSMNIFGSLQRFGKARILPIVESPLQDAGIQSVMHLPNHKLHLLLGLIADQDAAEMKAQRVKA